MDSRRPSGENIGAWKAWRSAVTSRATPERSTNTSERGSSGMYATVPLGATANWAMPVPVTDTPVAIWTGVPVMRRRRASNGTAIIEPSACT